MSLWNAYTRNDIKNVEWLLRESLVPHDQNYLYAVNTWYYLNSQGEEIVFDNDTVLTEDTTIYAKWRQANYYKFDGKYHELFHPQTPDTQNTNQFSNFGMLPYRSSGYANYFVGWFYKNNPNMEYFGEKVEPHTEFVSRYFKLTDESNFILEKQGDKNYMTLKDTFSSKDLVLPDYIAVYDEVKKSYTYVYDFIIDLTKFSNIKNIVFASYHMTFLNSVKIISNQNNIDINFFSSSQYYKIYGNYVYSVDTYFIEEYYQMRYQHIDDQNRTTDFKYSVLTLEGSVLKDLTTPLAMLPCENTDIIKNPIILEAKFMSYYREINNKVLFCDNSYLDSVRSKIFNGLFSGSIVYDISILQNKKDNYLIQNNELIYYMNRQADLDTVEKKLNVDLRDNPFLNIKKINTNSIIFNINYITEYTVNLYLSQNIEKIESRAIERSTTMNIYLYGQCPEIIFRANDSTDTYAQDGSVAPINIPNNLPHRNKISYMDLIYYFNSQFSDSYSAWASELSYSYQNVYFRTFES
jgi:hypothetical protein